MKLVFTLLLSYFSLSYSFCQDRHSFAGIESSIFSDVFLNIGTSTQWSTDRAPNQGFFSAVGTANYTNYSDAYNVNGYVKHYATAANQSYTFPVGTGTDVRTLIARNPIPANAVYATAWILGDPSLDKDPTLPNAGPHDINQVQAPLIKVSPVGQWDWIDFSNNSENVTITVSIPDVSGFSDATDLRLAGWDGFKWIDLSGGSLATGNTENSLLIGTMQAGITALAIGTIYDQTLPLNLLSFSGNAQGCDALIKWSTANETNVKHFELEQSYTGDNFRKIATIPATGGSNINNYSYIASQINGQGYYRLRTVDVDNSFKLSQLIGVRTNCNDKYFLVVFPNPIGTTSNGTATLSYRLNYVGAGALTVYNEAGKLILKKPMTFGVSTVITTVNLMNQPAGTYYFQFTDMQGKILHSTQKVIKL